MTNNTFTLLPCTVGVLEPTIGIEVNGTTISETGATLDGTLRKVVRRPQGFDANFLGMSRESADLACRRLAARNVSCFMIGPSEG